MVCDETEKVMILVGIGRLNTSWIYKFNGIDFSLVALYICMYKVLLLSAI